MWRRTKVFVINAYRLTYYKYNVLKYDLGKYDWSKAWHRLWRGEGHCVQSTEHTVTKPVQVPFMITKVMKEELLALEYSWHQIDQLTPLQAHNIITQHLPAQDYYNTSDEICNTETNLESKNLNQSVVEPVINANISRSECLSDQVKDGLSTGSITVCSPSDNLTVQPVVTAAEQPTIEQPTVVITVEQQIPLQFSKQMSMGDKSQPASSIVLQADSVNDNDTPSVTKVPFFITQRMKSELLDRGYTSAEINKLAPVQAHDILSNKPKSPDIQQTN